MTPSSNDTRNPARDLPRAKPGEGFKLLAGVRVLDLTTSIAGPYGTMILSDLGAEIIKLERVGRGDDSRGWGPPFLEGKSLWHASVNRNKKSVTLDYRQGRGRAVFETLVRRCDIVVTSQLPDVRRKLGTDYETLARLKPDIVYVSVTGFGTEGARADWPCYDIIAEGYSGVMDVTGEADSPPQKIGTPAADLLAGQDAALAAVAALLEARQSGRSHYVDIAMIESMTRLMSPRITVYLGSGEVPQRTGAKDSVIAVYQTFETKDEMITLAMPNDNIWHRFWEAVGRPDFGNDPRFATSASRHAHRPEIVSEIQSVLRTDTRDNWLRLFAENRIPAGPINRVDQVTQDAELVRRGLFYGVDAGGDEPVPQVGLGIHVDGAAAGFRSPPPELGQHTVPVLKDLLGLEDEEIEALQSAGLI